MAGAADKKLAGGYENETNAVRRSFGLTASDSEQTLVGAQVVRAMQAAAMRRAAAAATESVVLVAVS